MYPSGMVSVFIAENQPITLLGLRTLLLGKKEYHVSGSASDGEQAWKLIRELKPGLLILDLDIPTLGGFELIKLIKETSLLTKIVVFTNSHDELRINRVLDLGIKVYLLKTAFEFDFFAALSAALDDRHYISPVLSDKLLRRRNRMDDSAKHPAAILSPTEKRILRLVADDHSNKQIAESLLLSIRTVHNHRHRICKKLGVTGSLGLKRWLLEFPIEA